MKGNSTCHIPNDKYRENYDLIFRKDNGRSSWMGKRYALGDGLLIRYWEAGEIEGEFKTPTEVDVI